MHRMAYLVAEDLLDAHCPSSENVPANHIAQVEEDATDLAEYSVTVVGNVESVGKVLNSHQCQD